MRRGVLRILIAPNAFKGCLSAKEAALEMAHGTRRAAPRARLDLMPVSDGGDGLMEVLLRRLGGRRVVRRVVGPLGRPRRASYALLKDKTAVIEMAQASGIAGLKRLDPLRATSFGTGQLIRDALGRGCRRIVVGMGGSATNDGGAGMASALGARLLDRAGKELPRGVKALLALDRIDTARMETVPARTLVRAVSDVTNPLLGPRGSARVFGPQKGATPAMVRLMERALGRYARVLRRDLGVDVSSVPGGGAAGGLGAGLAAFLRARIVPGARWTLERLGAGPRIRRSDLVLTGEGRLDEQSFYGKAPIAVARLAKAHGSCVRLICGQATQRARRGLERRGLEAVYALSRPGEPPRRAMKEARKRLRAAAARAVRDFLAGALILGLLSPVAPAAQSPPDRGGDGSRPFAEVDRLFLNRHQGDNLERSISMLEEHLEGSPEDPQALWRLGRSLARAGERLKAKKERLRVYEKARAAIERSTAADPGNAEAYFWLGLSMGRVGQTRGILKSLFLVGPIKKAMRKVLELDPGHGGAYHILGEMYRQLPRLAGGSKKEAIRLLEKAVELDPDHTAHYPALAQAYLDVGDRGKARAILTRTFEVKVPDDPGEYEENLKDAGAMLAELQRKDPCEWKAAPPSLPSGTMICVMEGDLRKAGPFTVRLALQPGFRLMPHRHPVDERVKVVSGTYNIGLGKSFDRSRGRTVAAGQDNLTPAGAPHFTWSDVETVIEIRAVGPWAVDYL